MKNLKKKICDILFVAGVVAGDRTLATVVVAGEMSLVKVLTPDVVVMVVPGFGASTVCGRI